jgi:putative acetyltransferase
MDALEERAYQDGIRVLRLETGIHQHESLGLYFARGYTQRSPFGGYLGDPHSVFLEKLLSPAHTA